jgi:electron transfer flavoprotein alpha subunit
MMMMRRSIIAARRVSTMGSRNASCLVIAEHDNKTVAQSTLSAVTAATKIGGEVTVLVAGSGVDEAAKSAAAVAGVAKVLTADHAALANSLAESMANLVVSVTKGGAYSHVIAASSNVSKNYLPRAAAMVDASPLSDVSDVLSESKFKRPMYAGNAIATVEMSDKVKFLLVRPTSFDKAAATGGSGAVSAATVDDATVDSLGSEFVSAVVAKSDRPDLTSARVVVSGGRALKSAENFPIIFALADKLKGAVGASRAAVDAGYISNEHQVGQTGKVVAPELYIAAGISGAIQHVSGMKDSKVIVAINKDKEAPIFQLADYGLVEDLFKAVPEMTEKV